MARKLHILIVEDDAIISLLLQSMVEDLGYAVIGPAFSLDEGLALADRQTIDFALLDFELGRGTTSEPIADALARRRVPFAFTTAHRRDEIGEAAADVPVLGKPVHARELRELLPV